MRIGLFGGSFNPIHNAHLFVAEEVVYKYNLDKLFLIPAYVQPLKKEKELLESDLRIELIKKSINNKKIEISEYELKKKGISYTIDTINYFLKSYKNIYLIMGADSVYDLNKWKDYDKIINKVNKILIFPRKRYKKNNFKNINDNNYEYVDMPTLEISSTDIRKRIKEKRPYRYFVTEKVYNIIENKGLYK